MKIETLKDRIKKAEEKLAKLNGTLERHQKQLVKKSKVLTDQGIDLNNYDRYEHCQTQIYWDICDYDSKLEDIKNTAKKIQETTESLEKYKQQLENQLAKEAETDSLIPEVLNVFLENWKQKCFSFFIDLSNRYIALLTKDCNEIEVTREELEQFMTRKYVNYKPTEVRKFSDDEIEVILNNSMSEYQMNEIKREIKDRHIKSFRQGRFSSDMFVLDKIVGYNTINEKMLNKILDEDVKIKRDMFLSRIKQCIGEIKDLSGLRIGAKGDINGIAKGIKCNAKVETISAGGYAVQCYHFRVLVNAIKK